MAKKARLASRTIWTLEDIIASELRARRAWRRAHARAKRRKDQVMVVYLSDVGDELTRIACLARDGRAGIYRGEPITEEEEA